jgi:hypothetical protein
MPAEAAGDLVEEEMRLRKELSNARQELTTKKHTLEILRKEKDALEAQRPETLKEQVEDADAEIAELRKQLKEATGPIFGPVVTKPSPGRPGARSSAASGWGALINDAKSKTLDAASPVSSEPVLWPAARCPRPPRRVRARAAGGSVLRFSRACSLTHSARLDRAGCAVETKQLPGATAAKAADARGSAATASALAAGPWQQLLLRQRQCSSCGNICPRSRELNRPRGERRNRST